MERFLYLIKQKMNGHANSCEQEELIAYVSNNEKLLRIHDALFAPLDKSPPNATATEKAYLKQLEKNKTSP